MTKFEKSKTFKTLKFIESLRKMGRVRPTFIKRLAQELIEENNGLFSTDFDHNKEVLNNMGILESKVLRNRIAGQIIRDLYNKKY